MVNKFYTLKKGDTIGVAAPSARFDGEKLDKGISCLRDLGFDVHVPQSIFKKKRYLAGEDISRAMVVNELFADPDIKGIIAARGGFGAMRMLDYLDWELIQSNPKLFMGFSDATALLNSIILRTEFGTVHGPNLVSLADADPQTLSSFYQTITGIPADIFISQGNCLKPGQARGKLMGGNISTLTHLIGTRFQPDFNGAVLFLEDVGEPAYKIDRMLSQMKMVNLFQGIQGLITGSFENCKNQEYLPQILLEIFDGYGVPILMGLTSGHAKVNLSLAMGGMVVLDATNAQLKWQNAP
jgi:muramoyltetrapeptide carboxypeptidase